jgi:hypothetical protein
LATRRDRRISDFTVLTVPTVHMTVDTTPVSIVQATVGTVPIVDFGSSQMTTEGRDTYEPSIHATPEPVHVEQPVIMKFHHDNP